MRRIFVALAVVVAVAGWVFAFTFMRSADRSEDGLLSARSELSKTRAELSRTSDELVALQETQERYRDTVANLEEATRQLEDRRSVLAELTMKIDGAREELERLRLEAKRYGDAFQGAPRRYLSTTRAKLRVGSSTGAKQIAIVSEGVPISVYEMAEGGTWYKVGVTGYIYHELLRPAP